MPGGVRDGSKIKRIDGERGFKSEMCLQGEDREFSREGEEAGMEVEGVIDHMSEENHTIFKESLWRAENDSIP